MDGGIAADAEEHRMTEGEQTGLAQQHVVGQRQDAHHAHLAQHRDDKAGLAAGVVVVERPGHRDRNDQHDEPDPRLRRDALLHVSRVPISPRGRTIRMKIINRNGSSAPIRATGTVMNSVKRLSAGNDTPSGFSRSSSETLITTAKVMIMPIRIEAKKHPISEPRPPNTTTTNTIGPIESAMPGSVV